MESLPPKLCQLTAGDKRALNICSYLKLGTLVYGIAQFQELATDILLLWFLGLLIVIRQLCPICVVVLVSYGECQFVSSYVESHSHVHFSHSRRFAQQGVKSLVVVTVQPGAWLQFLCYVERKEPVSLCTVHPETYQFSGFVVETQSVSVTETGSR